MNLPISMLLLIGTISVPQLMMAQVQTYHSEVTNITLPTPSTPPNENVNQNPTSPMPLRTDDKGITTITLPTHSPLADEEVSQNPISPMPLRQSPDHPSTTELQNLPPAILGQPGTSPINLKLSK